MPEITSIEWCDGSWSPWWGCTKISPGCAHCYADVLASKWRGLHYVKGVPRQLTKDATWAQPVAWQKKLRKQGKRKSVFPSMCDPFDDEVDPDWLGRFLVLMHETPDIDWLLLTKRPELFPRRMCAVERVDGGRAGAIAHTWRHGTPMPNVAVGVSTEDQKYWDERTRELLKIPAPMRFVSVEPLLGPIDSGNILDPNGGIHWVILGGESGQRARACSIDEMRRIVKDCQAMEVPVFVKQFGRHPVGSGEDQRVALAMMDDKGGNPAEWPEDMKVRERPKFLEWR